MSLAPLPSGAGVLGVVFAGGTVSSVGVVPVGVPGTVGVGVAGVVVVVVVVVVAGTPDGTVVAEAGSSVLWVVTSVDRLRIGGFGRCRGRRDRVGGGERGGGDGAGRGRVGHSRLGCLDGEVPVRARGGGVGLAPVAVIGCGAWWTTTGASAMALVAAKAEARWW